MSNLHTLIFCLFVCYFILFYFPSFVLKATTVKSLFNIPGMLMSALRAQVGMLIENVDDFDWSENQGSSKEKASRKVARSSSPEWGKCVFKREVNQSGDYQVDKALLIKVHTCHLCCAVASLISDACSLRNMCLPCRLRLTYMRLKRCHEDYGVASTCETQKRNYHEEVRGHHLDVIKTGTKYTCIHEGITATFDEAESCSRERILGEANSNFQDPTSDDKYKCTNTSEANSVANEDGSFGKPKRTTDPDRTFSDFDSSTGDASLNIHSEIHCTVCNIVLGSNLIGNFQGIWYKGTYHWIALENFMCRGTLEFEFQQWPTWASSILHGR